jgi:hypothetical protein
MSSKPHALIRLCVMVLQSSRSGIMTSFAVPRPAPELPRQPTEAAVTPCKMAHCPLSHSRWRHGRTYTRD